MALHRNGAYTARVMRFLISLLLAALGCGGCGRQSATPTTAEIISKSKLRVAQSEEFNQKLRDAHTAELRQKLRTVKTEGGISKSDAEIIAECYFDQNVGCGAFIGIQDGGAFWIVDAKFGFAGTPVKDFQIDKSTGKITSPIGPSYPTPFQIFP